MRRILTAALALALLALAGCGSSSSGDEDADVKAAYLKLEQQLLKGDKAACSMMTGDFRNKLAASVQLFAAECPEVVKEVGKGLRADKELQTKSIDGVRVDGDKATLIAHSSYRANDVRTKVSLKRDDDGNWIVASDQQLDEVAPSAPLTAYLAYERAFIKGDGKAACALSTRRGQILIAKTVPSSHGGGTCVGAVPYLSVQAKQLPRVDVVGGDGGRGKASLYTLQSNGRGTWAFRVVGMEEVDGEWRFDYSRELGVAPAERPPRSDVV